MLGLGRGAVPATSAVVSLWAATEAAGASPANAGKEYWQKRYQELKELVASLEQEIENKRRIYSRKRHDRRLRGEARSDLLEQIAELEKQLAKAQGDLEAFPEEARRAGALPGWFRDL
jgi:DNA repair exonuclease SbcCD ATPase subunit